MGRTIKTAILFVNLHKKNATEAAATIQDELKKRRIETTVFSFEGKPAMPPEGKWDIAFSLGGDGTVLYTARTLAPFDVPILPVNLGSLGFISAVDMDEWQEVFKLLESGEVKLSRRCMLEISVERRSGIVMKNICLNDAVISATGIVKLIRLDVSLDSAPHTNLGSYRCDGLIIATPTGSTAYSMAAGGPILDPEMEAVIVNPICPFTLSNRPLVLPSRQAISVRVEDEQRSGVLLTVDGQDTFSLECADRVLIQQAPQPALLIFADRHAYYSALQTKLFRTGISKGTGGTDA
ncbi:MAG: NAD(+)/NADH kinase [Treponema sp.]|jgi:NAD+ kinase|nr:NAD(+)/NADH kinase [Treponema sp.]